MLGYTLTVGAALLIVAFGSQWLIKRRAQDKQMKQILMWVAWVFAALGGTALSINWSDVAGMTSAGATVVSLLGLLFIAVDLKDKRPDWPAFLLIAFVPSFMRVAGGAFGELFDVLLEIPTQFITAAGTWFGF